MIEQTQATAPAEPILDEQLGLWVDPDSGEIVGEAGGQPPLATDDEVERVLGRILRARSRLSAAERARDEAASRMDELVRRAMAELAATPECIEVSALIDQADRVRSRAQKADEWLTRAYEHWLAEATRQRLSGKGRSHDYLTGRVSLRTVAAKATVVDEDAACEALEERGHPDFVKRQVRLADAKREIGVDALAQLPGFALVPERETVDIKFGLPAPKPQPRPAGNDIGEAGAEVEGEAS